MNKNIYGWRGIIGLIYPSSSNTMEPEFYEMSPEGVITCTTRVHLEDVSVEGLEKMDLEVESGARLLSESYVDSIILGCTSGSFINGEEYNKDIIDRIMKVSGGIKATTTTTAIMEALKVMNIKSVAIATPYIDEVNVRAKKYFEDLGINVCNIKGLNLIVDREITERSLEENYRFAKEADVPEAEALLILCTSMRTVGIIDALEKDLGKPVITAIQASFWYAARLAGVFEKIDRYGSLLRV